jgi:hypothetical protein
VNQHHPKLTTYLGWKMIILQVNQDLHENMASGEYFDPNARSHNRSYHIISDHGSTFVSNFTQALNSLLGITENFSTTRQLQTDGQTEHTN